MFYPQEVVEQVIESNNIVEVIGSYVSLTKKGSTYFGLCPFHNEKTSSFSVTDNGSRHMFYCFGCHKGGSVLTFLMEYEGLTYTEALKRLADRAGISLPQPDYSKAQSELFKKKEEILAANKDAAMYFYHLLKTEHGKAAYNYLKNRGLDDETIKSFGLGYSDKYRDDLYKYLKSRGHSDKVIEDSGLCVIKESDTHDYFWNRAMFPIMDTSNRVIAFGGRVMGEGEPKYLNSRETICFEKSRNLYGLNVAKKFKGKELILCEGYMDVISLHQAGFKNAVASLGTALTENHASILRRYTDKVLISYDSDGAGQDAALRAIPKLKDAGIVVKIVNLSPYKDPDELIKAAGTDEYKERLKNAVNSTIFEARVLSRSFDMGDPEEKTRFGNEIANRISYIEDELERENYLQVLCNEFNLDYDILNSKVKKLALGREGIRPQPRKDAASQSNNSDKNAPKGIDVNQRMLLSYMAGEPSFYDLISGKLSADDFVSQPYSTIAEIMFAQAARGRIFPASVISSFEDPADQEKAAEAINYDFGDVSDEDRKKLLTDSIIRLKKNHISRLIESENSLGKIVEYKNEQEKLNTLKIF